MTALECFFKNIAPTHCVERGQLLLHEKKFQNSISLKEAALRKLECEVYEAQYLLKPNP